MKGMAHPIKVLLLVLWVVASLYWAGGLAKQAGVVAEPIEPMAMRGDASGSAYTPWEAAYPITDIDFRGHVYKAGEPGLLQPIPGAHVGVLICESPQRVTTTATDGAFGLRLSTDELGSCESVVIDVWADGYSRISLALSVTALRADPTRDFSLGKMAGSLFLPLMFRDYVP